MTTVFLIWDNSRAEHGEAAELVNIYSTREAAEAHIRREQEAADYGDIDEDMTPDEIAEQVEAATPFVIEEMGVIG